jgi:hypothetical protein
MRENLRQAARTPFRVAIRVTIFPPPGSEGKARVCHLLAQDLSASGVSIIYAIPFRIGQRIDLEMPDGLRSATVCRVTSLSDGLYLSGCQFDALSTDNPLH